MKLSKEEILYPMAAFLFGFTVMFVVLKSLFSPSDVLINHAPLKNENKRWAIESIDTMKYSRDMARQGLIDKGYADEVNTQIAAIASAKATYVAVDTPYDAEFHPILALWVTTARRYGLHIWFRGNWSGWEGWFNYSTITEQDHIEKTKKFITANQDLFQNGDIFTSCPECENATKLNLGDPQAIASYRTFLISEYTADKETFAAIGKNVASNYFSMNADAARAIMDKQTTKALDGIVVIDHYVLTPEQLASDVADIAQQSGGNIVLGEFGAPIPDIHGDMSEEGQKEWLDKSLQLLSKVKTLHGMNYWVNKGGSTALWRTDGSPKPAVTIIKQYY